MEMVAETDDSAANRINKRTTRWMLVIIIIIMIIIIAILQSKYEKIAR